MIFNFYKSNEDFFSAEVRNVKASRATRESYGDKAIGYVQLKRVNHICTVKAKVTPEHKIHNKYYNVIIEVDEAEEIILSCKCLDCAASEGGCKHGVAFLLWLHRRSEEPAVTDIECYWKVSKLSKVGSTVKFMTLKDLTNKPTPYAPVVDQGFLRELLSEGKKRSCSGTIFQEEFGCDPISSVSLHKLVLKYKKKFTDLSAGGFIHFMCNSMTLTHCNMVENKTKNQHKSTEWYEFRYGRITASKLYEASKCKTFEGTLVEEILGGGKLIETKAILRGRNLEEDVLREVSKVYDFKIEKCGLFLKRDFPFFGASPDGITKSHIFEVKCPSKEKTISNYIGTNDQIAKKPYAQMQLQMLMAGRNKGYLCIASPDFEKTKHFQMLEIEYDPSFTSEIMAEAEKFWRTVIFTHLIKL